ncbi:winged helix-turn-helix domain-containing protein [Thioclava sp. FR2]|uniref:winged helix-turn-helix domain-containing protein n=1 Tax=Thioclava sp. FR2 TaxID=3445780 RepID=UPI003EBE2153
MEQIIPNSMARRLFLQAHALGEAPSGPCRGQALAELINRIGFVQVDSINTVERAHQMILWSRRQSYDPKSLKQLMERDRGLFEHWTHDASIIPVENFAFWKHRFAKDEDRLHKNWRRWFREGYEAQFDTILERVAKDGPVSSSDVGEGEERGKGGWWDWHPSKTALEWLWRTGQLSVARRDGFRKVYDLTERVIPSSHLNRSVSRAELIDWACSSALDRLGFGDKGEIVRYWNAIEKAEALDWAKRSIEEGSIQPVLIEQADGSLRPSLTRPHLLYLVPEPLPSRLRILSPFDPALRDRARIERLFGFHYRIEVFVPEPKRQYGYYVFPVMEGEALIGRLDAKALRAEGRLHLRAFWPEIGVNMGKQRSERLMRELDRLARFGGCERVTVEPNWLRAPMATV